MKAWFGIAAAALVASSMPAQARFIATDTGDGEGNYTGYDSPGCASDIGGTCNAFDLGFTVSFGSGRTSSIYIYDDGQGTLGSPAGNGGSVFGPGSVAATLQNPSLGGSFYQTVFFDRDGGAFNVLWNDCSTPGSGRTDCSYGPIALRIVPDYVTRLVTFTLDLSERPEDGFYGSAFGYSLGNKTLALGELSSGSAYSLSVPMGVPEPASWGLMIVGFGAAGTALRRRRGLAATA